MLTFKETFSRLFHWLSRRWHCDSLTIRRLTRLETRLLVKIVWLRTASAWIAMSALPKPKPTCFNDSFCLRYIWAICVYIRRHVYWWWIIEKWGMRVQIFRECMRVNGCLCVWWEEGRAAGWIHVRPICLRLKRTSFGHSHFHLQVLLHISIAY